MSENMKYLYTQTRPNTAAHIWTGSDTACRMLSTGGIRLGKKIIHDSATGRRLCVMCQNNYAKEDHLGITLQDAHNLLDMAQAGLYVHPVMLTAALVVTGDVPLNKMEETYVEATEGSF